MDRPDRHEDAGELSARAASLELAPDELSELSRALYEICLESLTPPDDAPVFPETSATRLATLFRGPLPAEGTSPAALLEECREVARNSRLNNHPRMFGYVASPAAAAGALAHCLAAALNQNVTSWRSSPAATELERTTVSWLAELIGYAGGEADRCGGLLTSGGSTANLTALLVAQRASAGREADEHDISRRGLWGAGAPMTVYASDQIHLSVPKAADVLGIGREHVRAVASDGKFRLDVRDLRERLAADRHAGLRPFCVVASAGTVATGAVDPLVETARVAREHGLWFHVDGAYGAPAAAVPGLRGLFAGIELADSVSLDPHKWLYAPLGCGCLLLRDMARGRAAFSGAQGDYIKVFEEEEESFAFWDYGVELSRPFRALGVWAILRYYGARRIAACVAEDCALAARLGELVGAAEDFELMAPVTLGICCFRYLPAEARRALEDADGDDRVCESINRRLDEVNARIMHRVQRGGAAYLSNANLRGRFALRASITNFRTTPRDLAVTLDAVRRAAGEEGVGG